MNALAQGKPLGLVSLRLCRTFQALALRLFRLPPRWCGRAAAPAGFAPVFRATHSETGIHAKSVEISRDFLELGARERLAQCAEPGRLRIAQAASLTSGNVMPSGSTVLRARAM